MKTYYILDTDTNTWSLEHRPLKEITSMPGITGGHLLADARSRQTLTVAQALVSSRKTGALNPPPARPLLKLPASGSLSAGTATKQRKVNNQQSTPVIPICRTRKLSEYKVLGVHDECFGNQFNAANLELELNSHARQGWKVLSCVQSPANPLAEPKLSDLLIVMERKVAVGGTASA